ncbi:type II secretion system protein [Halobaculum magnesiiphilum]|uniref:Type II secretion system protein n=1 Tax=Halobaculum magnesiiphilum TaxID=1017351 RepID=A0A8T8WCK9_9EURY|nr:type II secretion system protein [Halobaculum magnesiiphilum]QZP37612.1 type II secretion system protein [Halobaculum magnesiiphilum]
MIASRRWPERYVDRVEPDGNLERACAFLGLSVDAERIATAAATVGVLLGACTFVGALGWSLLDGSAGTALAVPVAVGFAATVGWVAFSGIRRAPVLAAAVARTRAVADATTITSALSLSLRLTPVPERAVRFAADGGGGPLHRSLADHADRAAVAGAGDGGLREFAAEWREWFPALDRSVALLLAAADADTGGDRTRLLERAVAAVEDDLRDRTASFAGDLRAPVTGLYAFGVLLPLALVSTLPAAVAAGVTIPPLAFVATYDLVLPAALAVTAGRLLLRRPVALPAPRVDATHPDVPDRRGVALLSGATAAAVGWVAAPVVAGGWASPVLAAGAGVGTGLCVHLGPRREVRRTIEERNRGLSDALALIGRRVADGEAVERALPAVAASLSGPTADALAAASRRMSALGIPVGTALAGEGGPFAPERGAGGRAAAAVVAIAAAATEGRPAGDALVAHADRLDALAAAERDARRELAAVTGTLRDTAALFGPLVGGATVALAGRLDGLEGLGGAGGIGSGVGEVGRAAGGAVAGEAAALPASLVGPVIGVYVLALAATLTAFATGLERGLDVTVVGYRVGLALVAASGAFLAGHAAVAMLVA